jgi:glycyl-tRNA synthetase beta chain
VPELLLELLSEEIPARMQVRAAANLCDLVTKGLAEAGLTFDAAEAFSTPRRLALVVRGLPDKQPDRTAERKGPRADAPEKAVDGFLKSVGLSLDQIEERDTGKGVVLFAVLETKGARSAEVLPHLLRTAVSEMSWPKSMRWGETASRWVRPLHGLLAVLDGAALDLELDLGGAALRGDASTAGHRFLAPGAITVSSFDDYKGKLRAANVLLNPAERREAILSGASLLAKREGLMLREDHGLLDEVVGLAEWPVPLMGSIDREYLDLPPEVLVTAMRKHQRYFALESADGKLADKFVVVADNEALDGGAAIVKGNERVLRARLADAEFFWNLDRKATLASLAPALAGVVYHEKLGTLDQKVERVQALALELCRWIPGVNKDEVRSAARLAKADLVSGMVGEFPELQGIMGRYYALKDGESTDVADAVAEHYAPKGPDDRCPSAPVSVVVALADKIDTLAGFWGADEKPTGSKDPFALRRAALGVIRLILENGLRMPLRSALELANDLYPRSAPAEDLMAFFAARLKTHLREKGVRHDLIAAVFALAGEDDLVRLLARVDALSAFLGTEQGGDLLIAYRRATSIVRIEEKKDSQEYRADVDEALLTENEETELAAALRDARGVLAGEAEAERFTGAMEALSRLRGPVDAFFDKVTVNSDDAGLRANRLRLLSQITATLEQVADFSLIEG